MPKSLQLTSEQGQLVESQRVGLRVGSTEDPTTWLTKNKLRPVKLYDESEAWAIRQQPANVYDAADLPIQVLAAILRRHLIPETQIAKMVHLTRRSA